MASGEPTLEKVVEEYLYLRRKAKELRQEAKDKDRRASDLLQTYPHLGNMIGLIRSFGIGPKKSTEEPSLPPAPPTPASSPKRPQTSPPPTKSVPASSPEKRKTPPESSGRIPKKPRSSESQAFHDIEIALISDSAKEAEMKKKGDLPGDLLPIRPSPWDPKPKKR